jgi:signal transduction histidine kinase
MSLITIIWSMAASACLTVAGMYFLAWWKNRAARAHLLFAVTAASTAVFAFFELWMMRAQTPEELNTAMRWGHVPMFFWLLSLLWFVSSYLDAGRRWLAWTICALRALFVLPILLPGFNANLREIPSLQRMEFLGETVTIVGGVPRAWALLGSLTVLLLIIFVADASVTAWRRGDRRKALIVGGGAQLFLLAGLFTSELLLWGGVRMPQGLSLYYLGLIAVMAYELSRDVLRASQLVSELRTSEAVLRENQATLQARNTQISDLFGRLVAAQETERTRIARDLHDDVSQRIAGLSIAISGLRRRLGGNPDHADAVRALTSIQRDTVKLAEEIRHVSHDLHPSSLQHAGLVSASSAFCAQFEKQHGISVTYSANGDIGPVDTETALCLYRIVQEVLRNVAKHAGADHVEVALVRTVDAIQLSIADDGKGFDLVRRRRQSAGLGLVSIDERVRLLCGSVHIDSHPRSGTRVEIRIPHHLEVSRLSHNPSTPSRGDAGPVLATADAERPHRRGVTPGEVDSH